VRGCSRAWPKGLVPPRPWPAKAYPVDPGVFADPIRGFSVVAQCFEMTWGNVINTRAEVLELIRGRRLVPGADAELSRFAILTATGP
jgi:hypothetical protein